MVAAITQRGPPIGVLCSLAADTLGFAATIFGDEPDLAHAQLEIDAAIERCFAGIGNAGEQTRQISLTEFRNFCYADDFVRVHCFGETLVADARAHLKQAARVTGGGGGWGGLMKGI